MKAVGAEIEGADPVVTTQATTLVLLGGISSGNRLERRARLRSIDGYLERAVAHEVEASAVSRPERTSRILVAALDSIGEQAVDRRLVDALCIADRQYLLLQIAHVLDGDNVWLFPACAACKATFDVPVQRMALPVVEAGPDHPHARVELRGRRLVFRLPTGADECWIAEHEGAVSEREILARCLVAIDAEAVTDAAFMTSLGDDELEHVDAALDASSPDVGTRLLATCPECGHEQVVELDVATMQRLTLDAITEEVHTFAMYYHWSEAAILGLSRDQRHRYLRCIRRHEGLRA